MTLSSFLSVDYAYVFAMLLCLMFILSNRGMDVRARRLFFVLLFVSFIECVAHNLDEYFADYEYFAIQRTITSTIGYISRIALLFVISMILLRRSDNKTLKWILAIPFIASGLIILSSPFTKLVFIVDDVNNFTHGSLYFVAIAGLIYYILEILVLIFMLRKKDKWEMAVTSIALLFIVINIVYETMFYSGVDVSETTTALAILCYYMFFQSYVYREEKEHEEIKRVESENELINDILGDTIMTLAYAIDAKDKYTRGHSSRVAEYSKEIARRAGKSESECRDIYYAGFLHDIGKIGVPEEIINKPTGLTVEEYGNVKKHPGDGAKILSQIDRMPILQDAAHYHHERFDGDGYPTGKKGYDIPEVAGIIAVADAYDAMTSKRSYRNALSQQTARKEIVRGTGTQFDPQFANIMLEMIDEDTEFKMRETI